MSPTLLPTTSAASPTLRTLAVVTVAVLLATAPVAAVSATSASGGTSTHARGAAAASDGLPSSSGGSVVAPTPAEERSSASTAVSDSSSNVTDAPSTELLLQASTLGSSGALAGAQYSTASEGAAPSPSTPVSGEPASQSIDLPQICTASLEPKSRNVSARRTACVHASMYDRFHTKTFDSDYYDRQAQLTIINIYAQLVGFAVTFGASGTAAAAAAQTMDQGFQLATKPGQTNRRKATTNYLEELVTLDAALGGPVTRTEFGDSVVGLKGWLEKFADYFTAKQIARNVDASDDYSQLHQQLAALEDNAEDVENAPNASVRADHYEDRSELLVETYELLPEYVDDVHGAVVGNPAYELNVYSVGDWDAGVSSYHTIRIVTAMLRSTLIEDYQNTQYWLTNGSRTTQTLPQTSDVDYPAHYLTWSDESTNAFDTLDEPGDYAIYEVEVPERYEGRDLTTVVQGSTGHLDAYLLSEKPPADYGDDEHALEPEDGLLRATLTDAEPGTAYLLVRADRAHVERRVDGETVRVSTNPRPTYSVKATLWHDDLIPRAHSHRFGPKLEIVETGRSDVAEPTYPNPVVSANLAPTAEQVPGSRRVVEPGETVFVNVTVRNAGTAAPVQVTSVSFPDSESASVVDSTASEHFAVTAREPADTGQYPTQYWSATGALEHPIVTAANWNAPEDSPFHEDGEYHVTVRTTVPADATRFRVRYNAFARSPATVSLTPKRNQTDVRDQQGEFVFEKTFDVTDRPGQIAENWTAPHADEGNTRYDGRATSPAGNPATQWRENVAGRIVGSPAVGDEYVVVGTTADQLHAMDRNTGAVQWTADLDGAVRAQPSVRAGTAYVGTDAGDVYAFELDDGERQWHHDLDGAVRTSPVPYDGSVVVGTTAGTLYRLDGESGVRERAVSLPGAPSTPTIVRDTLYVTSRTANGQPRAFAFDLPDASREWAVTLPGSDTGPPPAPAVVDGTVVLGDPSGAVRGLDATSGAQLWSTRLAGAIETGPAVVDGHVYVSPADGPLHALTATNGTSVATFEPPNGVATAPTVADGSVFVGSSDWSLYALSGGDLDETWSQSVEGRVETAPVVANGTIYVADQNGSLHALQGSGRPVASFDVAPAVSTAGEPIQLYAGDSTDVDGDVESFEWRADGESVDDHPTLPGERGQVAFDDPGVHRISLTVTDDDGNTGTATRRLRVLPATSSAGVEVAPTNANYNSRGRGPSASVVGDWARETLGPVSVEPAVADGVVYAGSDDGFLYAVDEASGQLRWRTELGDAVASSPVVSEEYVFGGTDETLYALDGADGDVVWSYDHGGRLAGAPRVANETLVLPLDSGLVALDAGSGERNWQFEASGDVSVPALTHRRAFATVADGTGQSIVALGLSKGFEQWSRELTGERPDAGPAAPAVSGETVSVGDASGRLRALDVETGVQRYQYDFEAPIAASPTVARGSTAGTRVFVTLANGSLHRYRVGWNESTAVDLAVSTDETPTFVGATMYAKTANGSLAAIDPWTLDTRWRHDVEGPTQPAIGNGTLVVGTADGRIAAFASSASVDAERRIHGVPQPGERVDVSVTLSGTPAVDELVLDEQLPAGLRLVDEHSAGSFDANETTWTWSRARAGQPLSVNYTVAVSSNVSKTDRLPLEGTVGNATADVGVVRGDRAVVAGRCVEEAVAGADRRVSLRELQDALRWWASGSTVPQTGGETIDDMQTVQGLVAAWQQDGRVDCR